MTVITEDMIEAGCRAACAACDPNADADLQISSWRSPGGTCAIWESYRPIVEPVLKAAQLAAPQGEIVSGRVYAEDAPRPTPPISTAQPAAQPDTIPEGYAVLPLKATREMRAVCNEEMTHINLIGDECDMEEASVAGLWEAMSRAALAAARPDESLERLREADRIRGFAHAILHGDDDHREWLLEAAEAFIAGDGVPAARGKGTQQAARPDTIPAGYVLVPVEPTEAMQRAFEEAEWAKRSDSYSPTPTEHPEDGGGPFGYGYRAMIRAAAPQSKGDE